jgi:hypothetical protein
MRFGLVNGFIDHLYARLVSTVTELSLSSTIHKSPQHQLSVFQPAVSSSAVPWQRLLTVEILQLHSFKFYFHSSTEFTSSVAYDYNISARATQELCCCVRILCRGNVLNEPLPRNGHCGESPPLSNGSTRHIILVLSRQIKKYNLKYSAIQKFFTPGTQSKSTHTWWTVAILT